MSIDLKLNETQRLIQDNARDFFEHNCPTTVVRQLEASEQGYSPEMWRQMAELGWLGMTFPARYGGSGGSFLDMYPLYEEMGRFLVPSPHLDTVVIAAEAILVAGSEAQKEQFIRPIAEGRLIVSPAIVEPGGSWGPGGMTLSAAASGQGYALNGTKLLVPYVSSADYLLVVARTRGEREADGISLFLLPAQSAGISTAPIENIAGYALYEVTFNNVAVPAEGLLGPLHGGWALLQPVFAKAAVLQSAAIVGAGERVLEITANYARDRVQFGRPIGTNQAVQYMVTDILLDSHLARLLTLQAAWRIDQGLPHEREASIAKAYASKAAAHMTRQGHEVHAGVAFMYEHDMQLYSRRAKHWENNLGDYRYHARRVGDALAV